MRKLKNLKELIGHDTLLVGEFFKGYGSQSMSLDTIGVPNKVVVGSEIDTDAIISYASARHTQEELDKKIDLTDDEIKKWLIDRNIGWDFQKQKSSIPRMKKDKLHKLYNSCILENEVGDISIINPIILPNFDLMTYSFPCQSISIAGKMEGLKENSGTKSSLLHECKKVIEVKKPKFLLMENVKNLIGKKFKQDFDKWCKWLELQGYTNYWQVLNAKDYGIPQNRERVFMISILGEHDTYEFPQKQKLNVKLKYILEEEVDEKYYINNDKAKELIEKLKDGKVGTLPSGEKVECSSALSSREHRCSGWNEISGTLCARDYKDPKVVSMPCDSTTYKPKELDIENCITARYDAGIQNKQSIGVAVMEVTQNQKNELFNSEDNTYRIRKLTPKECFRLMGVDDEVFDKIQASGISNSQLYKQAGNSIVRNCLDAIFTELFFEKE